MAKQTTATINVVDAETPPEAIAAAIIGELTEPEIEAEILEPEPIVAALATDDPPAAFFADPNLTGLTPLHIDEETGRVHGHLAGFKTDHIGFPGQTVRPPKSRTDYAYFKTGAVKVAEGRMIPTGVITLGTGHADLRGDARTAAAHYDNTGAAIADVTVGEDKHGIWIAGALRPGTDPARIRELRGAALSGDWRPIRGNRELVAALAVNVPGFPIPRTEALAADGRELALVAAGIVRNPEPWETAIADLQAEIAELRDAVLPFVASGLRAQYPAIEIPAETETGV